MLYRTLLAISLSVALFAGALSPAVAQTAFQGEGGKVRVLSFPSGNDYPFWLIAKLRSRQKARLRT